MKRIAWGLDDVKDTELTEQKLGEIVDQVLTTVHEKYIDPDRHSEGIALIVGAVSGANLYLLSTHKRAFQFHDDFAYAGLGSDIAIYFLDRLYDESFDWEEASTFAGFVMLQVKQSAQACSGDSQIYALGTERPRWRSLGSWVADEIESTFHADFTKQIAKLFKTIRLGELSKDPRNFADYEEEPSLRPSTSRKSKGRQ